MNPIVLTNLLIIAAIALLGCVTGNPMTLFGLLLLQSVPHEMLMQEQMQQPEEDDGSASTHEIGFTAELKKLA